MYGWHRHAPWPSWPWGSPMMPTSWGQAGLLRRYVSVRCCAISFGSRLSWRRVPYLHGEVGRGPYLHGEIHSGGSARCRPRYASPASGYRIASVGSTAVTRFLVTAWTRAEGRVFQGYLRVPPGARSSVLPLLGTGQSAVYPGVPSGAAWCRCLVRPGGLRWRRARERWQA